MNKGSTDGGVMASREHSKSFSRKENLAKQEVLIYVEYEDHVLFRNCDSSTLRPSIRRAVGWLTFENREALYICSDQPIELLPNEKATESGLVILKSAVLNRCALSDKIFKQDRSANYGQEKSPMNGEKEKCKR
jgi:hypothetical protein